MGMKDVLLLGTVGAVGLRVRQRERRRGRQMHLVLS
jgi:hypothetical protein